MVICLVANIIAVATLNTAARCESYLTSTTFAHSCDMLTQYRCCHNAYARVILLSGCCRSVVGSWNSIATVNQACLRYCLDQFRLQYSERYAIQRVYCL